MRVSLLLLLVVAKKKKKADKAGAGPDELETGWEKTTNENGQRVQQLKVEAPALTEEDQKNVRMPDVYRCDACHAVMHKLDAQLTRARKKDMKSWEVIEAFDATCVVSSFEGYGVKLIGGENKLSGPGIPVVDTGLAPGGASIQMGGETWSARLATECKELVYDAIGEDELYAAWKKQGDFSQVCPEQPFCGAPAAPKPEKKKKASKEKKEAKPEKIKAKVSMEKKEDPYGRLTFEEYVSALPGRKLAEPAAFIGSRRAQDWDKVLIGLSSKLGAHYASLADDKSDL